MKVLTLVAVFTFLLGFAHSEWAIIGQYSDAECETLEYVGVSA